MPSRQVQNHKFSTALLTGALLISVSVTSSEAQTTAPQLNTTQFSANQTAPLRPPHEYLVSAKTIRSDVSTAKKMAKYAWLDKMVMADPTLVAAICSHAASARLLAAHHHIDKIAEADHYTCRRITKWGSAARILAKNPKALNVVTLDPDGLYRAIKHDRSIAKKLTKNPYFDQMIVENPDLGKVLSQYM